MIQNIATLLGLVQVVFELIDAIGDGSLPALVASGAGALDVHLALHPPAHQTPRTPRPAQPARKPERNLKHHKSSYSPVYVISRIH